MSKENNVEYERVDGKDDTYKRILVKFNPHFLRGADFEIEFIPLELAFYIGENIVTTIDSRSAIEIYNWAARHDCLIQGSGSDEPGTILNKKDNMKRAMMLTRAWRQGRAPVEPRQVISRIMRVFNSIAEVFNEPLSYAYNYFLLNNELGSLPFNNEDFNLERLKYMIGEFEFMGLSADGDKIRRPLVDHLFDTHKTEHVRTNICMFLGATQDVLRRVVERDKKTQQQ